MAVSVPTLYEYPAFRALPESALSATLAMWSERHVMAGQSFWRQGAAADSIALLLSGLMAVRRGRVTLGGVAAGEGLGFAPALLRDGKRIADVVALEPSRLLTLTTAQLLVLRREHTPVYLALLDDGLRLLAKHSRNTDAQIAELKSGTFAEVEPAARGLLQRVWRSIRPPKAGEPCPPLLPLLQRQPGLREVPEVELRHLAQGFRSLFAPAGEVLICEGDPSSQLLLLASGSVDVLRRSSSGSLLLGRVSPGAVLGVLGLVENGPRTASCVTSTPAWLYTIGEDQINALPSELRIVWLENMLVILHRQLRAANAALHSVSRVFAGSSNPRGKPAQTPADSMIGLLTAWGSLEAHASDDEADD